MRRITTVLMVLVGLTSCVSSGWCTDPSEAGFKSIGIREGISATTKNRYFHQYDLYAVYGLPWSLRAKSGWGVAMIVNGAVGALHAADETGFIGSVGPGVILDKGDRGFAFDVGGDLAFLTKYKFEDETGNHNLNGNPLFQGHFGLAYRFDFGLGVNYRFQHMSNGGFGLHGPGNPGVDLHMFGLSWNFK
jgi:hypothetical protein